jgi:hypothetical protein
MLEQGSSTLAADFDGRVLDRLAGLEKIISPEAVKQSLAATGRVGRRSCTLTHEIMLWIVLAMGILTDLPIRQVFKHARRLRSGETSPCCLSRHSELFCPSSRRRSTILAMVCSPWGKILRRH